MRELDRLREEALGAHLHRLHRERDVAMSGHHDDHRPLLARALEHVEPRHVRQLEVEQHERRMLGLDDGDRFLTRAGAQHVVPRPLEIAAEGGRDVRFVVDDEDLGHLEGERRAGGAGGRERARTRRERGAHGHGSRRRRGTRSWTASGSTVTSAGVGPEQLAVRLEGEHGIRLDPEARPLPV